MKKKVLAKHVINEFEDDFKLTFEQSYLDMHQANELYGMTSDQIALHVYRLSLECFEIALERARFNALSADIYT